jgi:shikimate dehydrogenase
MRPVTASTALFGVLGAPVAHSLSPILHNGWFADHDLNAVYVALPVADGAIAAALAGLWAIGAQGLNVTLPFKTQALELSRGATARARDAGAANTLSRGLGGWHADTTDGAGFLLDLDVRAPGWDETPGPWVVLGAGGAGRSLLHSLSWREPARPLILVNRSPERARAAAHGVEGVTIMDWDGLQGALSGAALVVQCTSRGLKGQDPLTPDFAGVHADGLVYDTVYSPRRTAFLEAARGRRTLDGLGMLVGQGALAFEIWTGARPDMAQGLRRVAAALEAA